MSKTVDPKIAEAIVRVREEKMRVIPGYDGVYGQLVIFEGEKEKLLEKGKVKQRSLSEFV